MLNFLFGLKGKSGKIVTQRQTIERALDDLNAVTALMEEKPKISFDPASGAISLSLPEQMPDEALALPAPEMADAD